jgi:hypothetical protein
MAVRTRRLGTVGLPPRGKGGADWWQVKEPVDRVCPQCGNVYRECVAVLEYLPEMDIDGGERLKHPGWDTKGWLAWWDCFRCGRSPFEVVDKDQVARWGRTHGGWFHDIEGA